VILQSRHFLPRNLGQNPNIPAAIKKLQEQFRDALETNLIDGEMISRPEPEKLCELACEPGQAKLIFVTGESGAGKSGVILQVVKLLGQREVPFLPLRLDTDYPHSNVQKYSRDDLNLPGSPSDCLRALAGERRAVLLVDQLDAIRWTSRNSDKAWEICKEILDDALRTHEMTVIVVGRTMDFQDDPKIKSWRDENNAAGVVSTKEFQENLVPLWWKP
jgi:hypothetical protein